jgi:hypothetical protein
MARLLVEERHQTLRRLDQRFNDSYMMDATRAMLLCDGDAAVDAILEMLPSDEQLAEAGSLGQQGEIFECRAMVARQQNRRSEYRRLLEQARQAYQSSGAAAFEARVAQQLADEPQT